jgi:hypothetical protein
LSTDGLPLGSRYNLTKTIGTVLQGTSFNLFKRLIGYSVLKKKLFGLHKTATVLESVSESIFLLLLSFESRKAVQILSHCLAGYSIAKKTGLSGLLMYPWKVEGTKYCKAVSGTWPGVFCLCQADQPEDSLWAADPL